ncbi:type VI secretion system secreted protein Hcp [Ereboglobus sp. PH5-5]|uniref:Hcp family type VI secretion system effector n=1 Tax=unclassified Ereboglobus TaxID=2626932 RepID=UPI002405371F|nr:MULTISPECIES: type VI secretion system tube protein Hcp [unclassified Ereboglobus]MDF9826554.1 type VI secretion system secreted protein Hcp [Ereboglobus sp. PH5-10]MDF9832744.1 type VI secretion system secreted protein Hcp [Ereboglobus sp. PH5-5]
MALEAYLYIEGVQGDSTSEVGKSASEIPAGAGPIEINSFSLDLNMPLVENRSGTGAVTVGRANFEDFETGKSLDISSGTLLFYCLSGKHINRAVVMVYRAAGEGDQGKPTRYLKITYSNIVITEVNITGSGDEMPSETLKFNYGKVAYTYYKTDARTGAATGQLANFFWDRVENSGTKAG